MSVCSSTNSLVDGVVIGGYINVLMIVRIISSISIVLWNDTHKQLCIIFTFVTNPISFTNLAVKFVFKAS